MSGSRPGVSNLNAGQGLTITNGTVIEVTSDNSYKIYNNAGTTNVIVDVSGRFDARPEAAQARKATAEGHRAPSVARRPRIVRVR